MLLRIIIKKKKKIFETININSKTSNIILNEKKSLIIFL